MVLKPVFSKHLLETGKIVLKAYNKAKSAPSDKNWNIYKSLNREYHQNLDLAEKEYNSRLNDRLMRTTNSKAWWKLVKEIIGRGRDESYPPMFDESMSRYLTDPEDKANLFNRYFLPQTELDTSTASLPDSVHEPALTIDNVLVLETEGYDQLKSLNISKASGDDGI